MNLYDSCEGDEGLMGALRSIGASGVEGATIDPLRASAAGADLGATIDPPAALRARRDPGDPGDLGEDVLDLLRLQAEQARYEEMRRQHQVDLNDERNLEALEDKGLIEHMRAARRRSRANAEREARLPDRATIQCGDVEGRRALSSLMTGLKEQQASLRCVRDEVHAHTANVGLLAKNEQPYGYPAVEEPPGGAMARCLAHLERRMMSSVADLDAITVALDDLERRLTLARRNYEAVVDGLCRRGAHFEAAYTEASEKGDE